MSAFSHLINAAMVVARKARAVSITYHRGAVTIAAFEAIPGESLYESADGGYQTNTWESRDFLLPATAIATLSPAKPEAGDYIQETAVDGTVLRYDVMAPAGERPWRYVDRTRQWMRVHTKLTDEDV